MSSERVKRLLTLIPMLAKRPGQKVAQVAQAIGISPQELLTELDLLTLVGVPPFSPDDFVELHVENDRIYVELNQRFSAPPKLNAQEAMALISAAKILGLHREEALATALTKLTQALTPSARKTMSIMEKQVDVSSASDELVSQIVNAIERGKVLNFDYFALKEGTLKARTASPVEVKHRNGYWYLSALCHQNNALRLFRIDHMQHLVVTSTASARPGRALSKKKRLRTLVEVQFFGHLAHAMKERFPDHRVISKHSIVIQIEADSPRWIAQWILGFGGDAAVLQPAWAVRAVARAVVEMKRQNGNLLLS